MGRPLNKKFFGNRNVGPNGRNGSFQNTGEWDQAEVGAKVPDGDDGIGGNRVQTVYLSNLGQYVGSLPYVDDSVADPLLPGGVRADNAVTYSKVTGIDSIDARGTGYQIGDEVTDQNGTKYNVTAVYAVDVQLVSGGTNYDNDNNIVFDSPANWDTTLILDVTGNNTGVLTTFNITQHGVWGGPQAAPTTLTATSYNTRDGADQNASGAVFNVVWGIWGLEVADVTQPIFNDDDGLEYPGSVSLNGGDTSASITPIYSVDHVIFGQQGTGYVGTETRTVVFNSGSVTATGQFVFAQDTGAPGSATNQENAIIAYVWQDGERRIADIVKQTGSHRYDFITNSDGTGSGKEDEAVKGYLKNGEASDIGEADITAYDSNLNEYWVTKITARKARVWPKDSESAQFAPGQSVKWTFGNAQEDVSVKIDNA